MPHCLFFPVQSFIKCGPHTLDAATQSSLVPDEPLRHAEPEPEGESDHRNGYQPHHDIEHYLDLSENFPMIQSTPTMALNVNATG
jgi:hypothetical protein